MEDTEVPVSASQRQTELSLDPEHSRWGLATYERGKGKWQGRREGEGERGQGRGRGKRGNGGRREGRKR